MTIKFAIDWDFIAAHEGARVTRGYVPGVGTSKSGVTIGTGVDLGQRKAQEIDKWDLSPELRQKLRGYCGLIGADAAALLKARPLEVTPDEARAIDDAAAVPLFDILQSGYDAAAGAGAFAALPKAARTIIASVAYQYGPRLSGRTPRFWQAATTKNWKQCVVELQNFGDAYGRRRQDEARYLQAAIDRNFAEG